VRPRRGSADAAAARAATVRVGSRGEAGGPVRAGNILVRVTDPNSAWGRVAHFFRLPPAPHLVLLDTGMVATLTPGDQRNLVDFFKARPGPCARVFVGGGDPVLLDMGMVAALTLGDQRNLVNNLFKARCAAYRNRVRIGSG